MRCYHFVWLYLGSYAIVFAGFLLIVASIFGVPTEISGMAVIGLGYVIRFACYRWAKVVLLNSNKSTALPVVPSGKWIDPETPLELGSQVLVLIDKEWYRGIIIRMKRRDRFLVHIVGSDPFWDSIHHRSKLQVDETDAQPALDDAIRPDMNAIYFKPK
jgi:hypothetical protein